uniref:Thanatin n=1 Tax=Riptortus pedestris TaxID=329032 RepID=S6B836_RIPPE|nr:thanatin [Riptortus pedestris]
MTSSRCMLVLACLACIGIASGRHLAPGAPDIFTRLTRSLDDNQSAFNDDDELTELLRPTRSLDDNQSAFNEEDELAELERPTRSLDDNQSAFNEEDDLAELQRPTRSLDDNQSAIVEDDKFQHELVRQKRGKVPIIYCNRKTGVCKRM